MEDELDFILLVIVKCLVVYMDRGRRTLWFHLGFWTTEWSERLFFFIFHPLPEFLNFVVVVVSFGFIFSWKKFLIFVS